MLTISLLTLLACSEDTAEKTDTDPDETIDTNDTTDTDTEVDDTGDTEEAGVAQVRLIHLSPDAPAVDIFANGEAAGIDNFNFLDGTGFIELPAGNYSFAVAPSEQGFENAVPVTLDVELKDGDIYTAVAHGYLDTSMEANGFAITPFAVDTSMPDSENFKIQVVHAAAAGVFAKVDIWNFTNPEDPQPLITDFNYGEEVTTELPMGAAFVLGVDINADADPEAFFDIPDNLAGFVGVYAVNDVDGNPWLIAHFEDGTTAPISPAP